MKPNHKLLRIPLYVAALFLLLAGGLALFLSFGPVNAGWMAGLIRSSIEAAYPGTESDFSTPVIQWNRDAGSLDISVANVSIRSVAPEQEITPGEETGADEQGAVRLVLPRVAIGISLRSLISFSPAATRIDLFEPDMEIRWSAAELRRRLLAMPRATYLPAVRPQNRKPSPGEGQPAGPDNPDSPVKPAVSAARTLAQLPQAFQMAQRLLDAPDNGEPANPLFGRLETVHVHSANISIIEEESGTRWQIRDGQLELRRDEDAPLMIADVTLEAGAGSSHLLINTVAADDNHRRIDLQLENLDFGALAREVGLGEEFQYAAVPLSGEMRIDYLVGLGIERIAFELGAGKGMVDIPQLYAGPRALDDLAIAGEFDLVQGLLRFDSIYLAFQGTELSADGLLVFTGSDLRRPDLKLFATARNLDIRTLVEYWPKRLGRSGQSWVDMNMPVGRIPKASFEMHILPYMWGMRPLPATAMRIDFQIEDATAFYLKGMPPIEKGEGTGMFTTDILDIRVSKAEVDGIALHDSRYQIDQVGYRNQQKSHTVIRLEAPLKDILRLIDFPPLNYTTRYNIPAAEVYGNAYVVTELNFQPKAGLKFDDIDILVEAQVNALSYPTLLSGGGLTDGSLRMTLTRKGVVSSGRIKLNGADFHLNWTQNFIPENEQVATAHYELTGALSGADMARFGVPAVPDILDRAHTHLFFEGRGGKLTRGSGHVDLAGTGINSKRLSWSKTAGTPGNVEFDMVWTGKTMSVENIVIQSPGISAEASFLFDSETATILAARVPLLKTSGQDLALVSDFIDGQHRIRVTAQQFDARAWLDGILSGEDHPEPPMDIEFAADHVMTMNGIAMSDAKLSMINDGNYWSAAKASAVMDDGGAFELDLLEDDEGRHLTMQADEAGRLALGFGLFRNGSGGLLTMAAELNLQGESSHVGGEIKIKDFSVVKSSGLAKAIVARTGQDVDNYLGKSGFRFRRLNFPFTFEKGVVDISEARANGPRIGFTMRGQVNRSTGELNIDGVIVPAYAFNSLLGNIPLVGGLLTGGKGGGLFALTYRMEGNMSAPDITVNPLSALAPGFLRKIFEGSKGAVEADPTESESGEPAEGQPMSGGDAAPEDAAGKDSSPRDAPGDSPEVL